MFSYSPGNTNLRRFVNIKNENLTKINRCLLGSNGKRETNEFDVMSKMCRGPLGQTCVDVDPLLKNTATALRFINQINDMLFEARSGDLPPLALKLANEALRYAETDGKEYMYHEALWARCEVYLKSGDYILCLEDCDEISQILGRGHPNWARRIQSMKRRVEFLIEQHECKRKLLVVKCADEKIMAALAKLKEVVVREPRASVNDPRDDPFTEIFGLPLLVGPRKKDPSKNLRFELFEVPLGLKNSLVGFLGSTAHEGDYIVAAQDYRPSDVIAIQHPSCMAVNPNDAATCHACLKPISCSLVPCPFCLEVGYCSHQCRMLSEPEHKYLCYVTTNLTYAMKESTPIMPHVVAAVKLIVAQGLDFWLTLWAKHWQVLGCSRIPFHAMFRRSLDKLVINEQEIEVMRKMLKTSSGYTNRDMEVNIELVTHCMFATQCLDKADFFYGRHVVVKEFFAGLLLKLSGIIWTHGTDLVSLKTEITGSRQARALFPFVTHLKNSCNPNAMVYQLDKCSVALRALRTIKKGEPITISRGPTYAICSLDERQKYHQAIGLKCDCVPCTKKWVATVHRGLEKEKFKCPECSGELGEHFLAEFAAEKLPCPACSATLTDHYEKLMHGVNILAQCASKNAKASVGAGEPATNNSAKEKLSGKGELVNNTIKQLAGYVEALEVLCCADNSISLSDAVVTLGNAMKVGGHINTKFETSLIYS